MNSPSATPPMDEELAALRGGRTSAACAKIVALHGPLVKAACFRILRDEGMAEDAAQETFLLLMRKAQSLPPGTSLGGWLYHAAYRTALNHRRAAMRRRIRETSPEALNQMTPDPQPNPWTEIAPHLDEAMLALPERQRNLVVHCYFQNQSQRATAALLGCSESVVSRELNSAVEALRRFFARRHITVGSVALAGLLSTHGASATVSGSAAMVTAMMTANMVTASGFGAALLQSKLLLATAAVAGAGAVAVAGYHLASSVKGGQMDSVSVAPQPFAAESSGESVKAKASPGTKDGHVSQGNWEGGFRFTSAMALEEKKKAVLLEGDPEVRYKLLQDMGVRLSRAAFDTLIAKGMDASVAPWRDTFAVLANRTEPFDHYVMAWSNEDPLAALNWVASQPDGGLGMRKQLLYALMAKQFQPDALRDWISGLTSASMKHEASLALESMSDPSSPIAHMGRGDNEGFLVDLALLQSDRLDWSAFSRKLATGKSAIVARAMRQVLDGGVSPEHLDQMILELARSPDANISLGAVTILRAACGDPAIDYRRALQLAVTCDQAGMSDFSSSIFRGWAVANPQDAVQHASSLKDLAGLREVIRGLTILPDEATLESWLAAARPSAHDIALTSLYARSTSGTFAQLQKIAKSSSIIDQVEAAKEVMRLLPLADAPAAAQWLKQLPAGKDRQEIANALVRRLSAVDPQATLELIQSEGLRGVDYEAAMSNAVTQFAARNDLTQSTRFIEQITDSKAHADALGQLAMVKFPGRPQEAYAYLQAHSRGDWQAAALRMLSDDCYNKLGNVDANAAEFLKLDLSRLGPEVANRASVLCKIWIDNRAPLDVPLAWTQQLPGEMGRETRLLLARNNGLRPWTVQQYQSWVETAPVSPEEKAALLKVLRKRPG